MQFATIANLAAHTGSTAVIDWKGFIVVAVVTLIGAGFVVLMYSLGVRLTAVSADSGPRPNMIAKWGSWVSFGLCGLAVAVGIVLIVPVFYKTAMGWFGLGN
ncbi:MULTISPECIES: hypothetical protein [unclassified Arthrobacter]|uniref:hypothetical protein n=1 Tax=unclassified Arthrobacter TaxID=235627 RepID=UPI00159DA3A5|nr:MULTISPECIES: hypothetical protein [unclassified Arthrobacter]MCQ9164724.1 hypothetical protein [Arthrobacter sp. STN4]NVM99259.1 hypothetical protein [Arthrobacter sp. SDTb3-6]